MRNWQKKFNKAIFPGTQGGPLEHVIAAKAVCFGEALKPEFKAYQQRVVTNARVLAEALQKQGFDLVGGGTDNHLMLIDLRKTGVTGKELQRRLDEVYITANKNAIPNDPESPFVTSGMRIGTPAVTTRGFGAPEMLRIAEFIWQAATDFRQQGKRYPPKCTRYLRKIFQFTNIFADSLLLESAFCWICSGLHNAKLPVRNRRADKVFVRFEQNACLFPSVCYT